MIMMRLALPLLMSAVLLVVSEASMALGPLQYQLEATEITRGVWVVEGRTERFSRENGGNIVNTAFIETDEGVVVIDSGPSRRYGEAFRELIETTTAKPVTHVLITHHHPDHAFGNQAFEPETLYMLSASRELLARDGEAFSDNMYRLVGDWMRGTEIVLPPNTLDPGEWQVGNRRFRLLEMTGHTGADLVVFEESSGVLFAADMLFFERALTTPQSPGLDIWAAELDELERLPFRWVVPGHGPAVEGDAAFRQMRDYLAWLDRALSQAATEGLTRMEVMNLPIPQRFQGIAESRHELIRTTTHLYPHYEKSVLGVLPE